MGLWFTADPHFGHRLMARLRGFDNPEEMNRWLIARWNERVQPDDQVWLLGDVAFMGRGRTEAVLAQLRGQIHLVRGNHDRSLRTERFASQQVRAEIAHHGHRLVLDHFPLESWHRSHHGAIHLHGHCHGRSRAAPRRLDVGVDTRHDLAPYSFEEVLARLPRE